jgi:hypothetical protein
LKRNGKFNDQFLSFNSLVVLCNTYFHSLNCSDLYLQLENLEYILLRLNSVPDVWQIPVFPKAWQNILVTPLTKGEAKRNLPKRLVKYPGHTIDLR